MPPDNRTRTLVPLTVSPVPIDCVPLADTGQPSTTLCKAAISVSVLFTLALLWLSAASHLVAAEPAKAVVRRVAGAARWTSSKDWNEVVVGQELKPGATLRTGSESEVQLYLGESAPRLVVAQNSDVVIERLDLTATDGETVVDTRLILKAGQLQGSVAALGAKSKYEITIPGHGVIGVKAGAATDYSLAGDGWLTVSRGTIILVMSKEQEIKVFTVTEGNRFNPKFRRVEPVGSP